MYTSWERGTSKQKRLWPDMQCSKHTYCFFLLVNSHNFLNYLLLSMGLLSSWCLQTKNLQFLYLLSLFYCHLQSVRKFSWFYLSRIARLLFFSSLALAFIASLWITLAASSSHYRRPWWYDRCLFWTLCSLKDVCLFSSHTCFQR